MAKKSRTGVRRTVLVQGAWLIVTGVDERDRFYVGCLAMDNPTVGRGALMVVMARRTPVRHLLVSHHGIKKPHGVRRTVGGHRLWLIVTGRG